MNKDNPLVVVFILLVPFSVAFLLVLCTRIIPDLLIYYFR